MTVVYVMNYLGLSSYNPPYSSEHLPCNCCMLLITDSVHDSVAPLKPVTVFPLRVPWDLKPVDVLV